MDAGTCSACTQSQVTHQPVTDYMSYCPDKGGSFVKTGSPNVDEYYTKVIDHLNDGLTFSETEDHRDLDEEAMQLMHRRWLRNERRPEWKSQPTTAEKEEYLRKWNEWMDLKAMTMVPQAYKAYINGLPSERARGIDVAALVEEFTQLEVTNWDQNGPDIELEDHQKRKLASVTRAILNGAAWRLGAYRVFHYYLESEAQVKDLDMGPTFDLTIQTKESSGGQ